MMLSHLGEDKIADIIEEAKITVIKKMDSMLAAKMGYSTTQIGDMVADLV
jgi:3-isopropylmalate dehydrogenase